MRESHLFEYAVIRVVPQVEREEFINVGVILYCAKQKFLKAIFHLDEARITAFSSKVELVEVGEHLIAFERICMGNPMGGTIGKLDIASRFRWLTAIRSTVIQTSRAHAGLCISAEETLTKLYQQLVLLP